MKSPLRTALILAALTLAATFAQAAGPSLVLRPESKLWLDGKSTVHAYTSKATKLEATIEHDPTAWANGPMNGEALEKLVRAKGVKSVDVVVPVAAMRSGKDGLDRNMQKALLATKHPDIHFVLSSYEAKDGAAAGDLLIDAKGTVTVAGVARDIAMTMKGVRAGDAIRLTSDVPLLMSWFKVKPPTMMMGSLRTADQVIVHFDLVMAAQDPSGRAAKTE